MVREINNGMYIVKRRRVQWRRFFLFRYFTGKAVALLAIALLFMLTMLFASKALAGENTPQKHKTVASVCIQKGDTLWSIADRFYSDEFSSIQTFIEEIKHSNGLKNDTIHAGAYLIVPYYSESAK